MIQHGEERLDILIGHGVPSVIIACSYIIPHNNQFYKYNILCYHKATIKKGVVPHDKNPFQVHYRYGHRCCAGPAIIVYTFVCLFTGNITPLSRVTAMLTPVWFVAELTLLCTLL